MKVLFSISLFLVSSILFSQQVIFSGKVQDSIGSNLASASVVVANLKTNAFQGFGITDDAGFFEIGLKKNTEYIVKITYMGYKSVLDTIEAKTDNIYKIYKLIPDQAQLEGVELKYEMPVKIKGDTIVYNADSFTTGNEKKLEDVIKKMPGLEVEKDGTIKVEGKEVKKVMVEGKDFFEGDSKLASKNIPANAVKKVEVLRNFNDNAQLKKFEDNDDSYAINIRLKEGKEKFWFGEVTAGGGYEDKYFFHPKLFYYSPKYRYNIIGDANNVGSPALSWKDIFKLQGGFSRFMSKSGSTINTDDFDLGFAALQTERNKKNEHQFLAFNYNITASKSLNLKGYLIGNKSFNATENHTDKIYLANSLEENTLQTIRQDNLSGLGKFSLEYNPNLNFTLNYDFFIKSTNTDETNAIQSNLRQDNNTTKNNKSFALSQNIEIYKTLKNNNLLSFEAQHKLTKKIPVLELVSKEEFFATSSILQLQPQQTFDLIQNKKANTNKINTLFDYFLILNDVSHLDISVGNELVLQDLQSDIQQKLDNGTINTFNNSLLKNDAQYLFSDVYAGLHYKLLWKKLLIRPSINLHNYQLKDQQFDDNKSYNQWNLLPELKLKYKIKRGESIRFSYNMSNAYWDISKYAQGYLLSGYNNLSSGNRDLKNIYKHNFRLNYSVFNMMKFYHLFTGASYTKSFRSIGNKTNIIGTDIISYPVNLNNPNENMSFYAGFGKRYPSWNYKLNTIHSWNRYYSILNGNETQSSSFLQNYKLQASTNLEGFLNFDVFYNFSVNNFNNTLRTSTYITDNPAIGLELSFFDKALLIKSKYDYYYYRNKNKTTKDTYSFLTTDIYYSKNGSKWEFILSGSNLLNNKILNKESLSDLYLATSKYYIQPMNILLKINYKL